MMLGLLGLATAAFALWVLWLLFDGIRAFLARRRAESHKRAARMAMNLVVKSRSDPAHELFNLTLAYPEGKRLPAFLPGQFITVRVPAGANGSMVSRRYSLSAWARRPREYQLGIRWVQGGKVSSWLHQHARFGTSLEILPPAGEFVLEAGSAEVVLAAGGIGITPMAAMVDALAARPSMAGRVWLFQGAREEADLLGRAHYANLDRCASWFSYRPFLSRPDDRWTGGRGRMSAADLVRELIAPTRASYYLCARKEMMDELTNDLIALGVPGDAIHREAFGAAQTNADDTTYAVMVDGHGSHTFQGQPSLLHALEEWGVPVEADCRAGECGACKIRLKRGEVRYCMQPHDTASQQLAASECLACCAVPHSVLEIALH